MNDYSTKEILQYIEETDVKFIRLTFCDVFGQVKNISVMPGELNRAFAHGIAIDASAIAGFGGEVYSDLLLHPDPGTIAILPWRPEHGRVVRMFCDITTPDGAPFACDTRALLRRAAADARAAGIRFSFGAEMEFYLFRTDETGAPTAEPFDHAGYMDVAPADRGENVRREICLTLEKMGIQPESSHHEEGPGQNEIDFRYSDPLTAADQAVTFRTVVQTVAARNGLAADFSPKPLPHQPGSGFHINISAKPTDGRDVQPALVAGILHHIADMTRFLNPTDASFDRLGVCKAPQYITWSRENRSQLIRIPAAAGEFRRAELRSPDSAANPYLAFALLIYAALDGIGHRWTPDAPADFNLFTARPDQLQSYRMLPRSRAEAAALAAQSAFIAANLPRAIVDAYCSEN